MSVEIINADVMEGLSRLEDNAVEMCFTSPPYWGLRDYGFDGQIGMEETWAEHVEVILSVFREVRRVLKPEGTLWFNYGDCYASSPNGRSAADVKELGSDDRGFVDKPFSTVGGVFKPKDLLMMPARLAIALQEDGWWLRSEIIWAKPNPMPESIKDRPATSHEKIYLLSKSARYHYDADAVRMPSTSTDTRSNGEKHPSGWASGDGPRDAISHNRGIRGRDTYGRHTLDEALPSANRREKQRGHSRRHAGFNDRWDRMTRQEQQANGRNLRNYESCFPEVWNIATAPFKDAHFATFPPALVAPGILAGCPIGGTILDPFGGSGTVGLVADRLQRNAVLIEGNPAYAAMARDRINGDGVLFPAAEVAR